MNTRSHALLLALAAAFSAPLPAAAQSNLFPQTLAPNTVVGRLGIGAGPPQAIPFTNFANSMFANMGNVACPISCSLKLTTGIATAPVALPGTQRPVNLYNCSSDNVVATNIECSMTVYAFGGPAMTGNRFGSYSFIFNTAATNNSFGQYAGTYGEAYTSVGDGGSGGSPKGAWFGGNFACHLDTGSGAGSFSCQGAEFDTIIAASPVQAKYVMGIAVVGSNANHAATMETAIAIGGSDIAGFTHLGWNKIFTLTDLHDQSPVNANTIVFDTYWTAGGTKAIKTWANLVGLTGSDFILNSTNISIDWSGVVITTGGITGTTWTGSGAAVILNATAPPAGGTAGFGYRFSSTANLGLFFGSGAPTLAAAQGSLYVRTDGTGNTLLYSNNNGTTGWSPHTTGVGVSQTCTVNTASALTLIFTLGLLTGGTCNT